MVFSSDLFRHQTLAYTCQRAVCEMLVPRVQLSRAQFQNASHSLTKLGITDIGKGGMS